MKCIWEFTWKVELYLADSVTASSAAIFRLSSTLVCDMTRINAFFFFFNSWRRHFISELSKGYATRSVIVLFRRKCFVHRMFFSLASYDGSAIKGTVLYLSGPRKNSEIECLILWLKIVNFSPVSKINPGTISQLSMACGKYISQSIYILKCALFCIKHDKWKNK